MLDSNLFNRMVIVFTILFKAYFLINQKKTVVSKNVNNSFLKTKVLKFKT